MIFCLGKVSSGRRRRPAPRVPPGPAALGGWGGEGAPRTPGVPPRSRGGRRRAQGEAPQKGVKGRGGEGKERTAAPGPLTTPPRPSHIGVPAPPARGWLLGWGPRLIHSAKGCYGPGRPDRTVAKLGTRRARIGAAPAPGSSMCRGGRDPLPTPWGVLRPTPRGEAESPAPRGRPLPAEQLPVPTRGSRLPAPRPRARAPAPAGAPAGAPAPACAAAAAGREGKGGSRRRPRLPLARTEAKVSAAASARAPGLSDARSLTRFSRSLSHRRWRRRQQRPELSSLSPSLCAGLSPHSREGREESGARR